ncbi:MFS transporter [Streptomyces sp. NPDC056470]|uniref:MFS transporter n=1 Tax=Streptomyces sp. NPDC056470 TaxID=3345831 RepID=UPI00367BF676
MLGSPYAARLLGGTLIGRLPSGMAPVAIVLLTVSAGGGIGFGGLLSALYGLASALAQPVKGHLLDRYGQTAVHTPSALINSGLLLALPLIDPNESPVFATTIVAAAGLFAPALEAGLRALWPSVLPDTRLRHAALALDTGTQGLLYVAGPLLVAALACAHGPEVALAFTAALGLVGTAIVATTPPSRLWRPEQHADAEPKQPLASAGLVLLFVALGGIGFALGAMNVWAVAMGENHKDDMLPGLLPAASPPAASSADSPTDGEHGPASSPANSSSARLRSSSAGSRSSRFPARTRRRPWSPLREPSSP